LLSRKPVLVKTLHENRRGFIVHLPEAGQEGRSPGIDEAPGKSDESHLLPESWIKLSHRRKGDQIGILEAKRKYLMNLQEAIVLFILGQKQSRLKGCFSLNWP